MEHMQMELEFRETDWLEAEAEEPQRTGPRVKRLGYPQLS
jgi:hypothetical protein